MARKKKHEEHENHERWLVSYADFITLLFAFFVVMYSVSSVNEGKYRVLSESLVSAFSDRGSNMNKIQMEENPAKESAINSDGMVVFPMPGSKNAENEYKAGKPGEDENAKGSDKDAKGIEEQKIEKQRLAELEKAEAELKAQKAAEEKLQKISSEISDSMKKLIDKDIIKVKNNKSWVEVEIKSSLLFTSGSAAPSREAQPVLDQLAELLKVETNPVHIEGFTDNVPIKTPQYPSNWELSGARAGAVVRLLEQGGVPADRLAAIGYGENKPIADNSTDEGRAKNRRVVMVISRDPIGTVSTADSKQTKEQDDSANKLNEPDKTTQDVKQETKVDAKVDAKVETKPETKEEPADGINIKRPVPKKSTQDFFEFGD